MQRLIENDTKSPMYFRDIMIPPGETRMVEDGSPAAPAPPDGPDLPALMRELLEGALGVILPELAGMTNEALDLAQDEESAGKNRKTLLAAIDAERIRRADEKLQAEQEAQAAAALEGARAELLSARVALTNLGGPHADPVEREAAIARVDECQARVDALTPDEV